MEFNSNASKKIGKRKNKLDPVRDDLQLLVDRANYMVSQLKSSGLGNSSAIQNAMATLKGDSDVLFSVQDKHRFRELKREAARISSFLSEAESQVQIASQSEEAFKAVEKHKLSFHAQKENLERTGFRFGTNDEERVKFAMEIFRRVKEEPDAVLFFEKGSERFDSDTLINLIYDSVEDYNPNLPDKAKDELIELARSRALLAMEEQRLYEEGFLKGSPLVNVEQGIISNIKKATKAEDFLSARNF